MSTIIEKAEEANLRNYALRKLHGRIPSYIIWREDDISDDIQITINWWTEMLEVMQIQMPTISHIAELRIEKCKNAVING